MCSRFLLLVEGKATGVDHGDVAFAVLSDDLLSTGLDGLCQLGEAGTGM